jgi:transposase-like protein
MTENPTTANKARIRRHYTMEERRRIVAATYADGATVQKVADLYGMHSNTVYNWRTKIESGQRDKRPTEVVTADFVQVGVIGVAGDDAGMSSLRPTQLIEIELRNGVKIRIDAAAQGPVVQQVIHLLGMLT